MFQNFLKEKFNIAITISLIGILVLTILFIFLNLEVTTHVRSFEVNGGAEKAELKNTTVKVSFSGPMNKDSSDRFISVSPSTEFSTAWSNNVLYVIFKKNLNSNTEYSVKVSSEMKDVYNKNLSKDFVYDFKTESLNLAFIKSENNTKKVVLTDANLENSKDLFNSPDLRLFALNKDYLVVVTRKDNLDNLQLLNLKNGFIRNFNIESSVIERIDFSPLKNEFIYLTQEVTKISGYNSLSDRIDIHQYNIDTNESRIINADQPALQVIDIKYLPDGESIMYKTADGYYNLMPINNPNSQTQLGRFLADGGFNNNGDKAVFVGFDPAQTFAQYQYIIQLNADRSQENITDGSFGALDPQYFNNDNSLVFAQKYKELEATKGIFKIVRLNEDKSVDSILEDENQSLELPKVSPDDRYIVIEKYTEEALLDYQNQRNFLFQTKPNNASLIIYDLVEKKIIDHNIQGIEAKWVY